MRRIAIVAAICTALSLSAQTRSKTATEDAADAKTDTAAPKKKPSFIDRMKAKAQASADRMMDSAGKTVENTAERGTKSVEGKLGEADSKVGQTLEGDKSSTAKVPATSEKPANTKR